MTNPVHTQFDSAFRGVSAYAILRDGKPVGRVIIKYNTAVSAYVQAWTQPMVKGQAWGGGYDRASAAVQAAAVKLASDGVLACPDGLAVMDAMKAALTDGRDGVTWTRKLEDAGFVLALVI